MRLFLYKEKRQNEKDITVRVSVLAKLVLDCFFLLLVLVKNNGYDLDLLSSRFRCFEREAKDGRTDASRWNTGFCCKSKHTENT